MDVPSSYDSAAEAYVEHVFNELAGKPLDRHLLDRFAEAVAGRGAVADLGCGPGHVAKYLRDRGVDVCGVDLSPRMVACARRLCPEIEFRIGDMRTLDFASASLAGAISFYSIVHFAPSELEAPIREWRRVLKPGGVLLTAFHIGDETVHVDELWGSPVSLDFRFHQTAAVVKTVELAGFTVSEITERRPYPDVEYQSRRCYLFATAA